MFFRCLIAILAFVTMASASVLLADDLPADLLAAIKATDDPDPKVRCAAAKKLGELGDQRAVDALVAMFDDKDPNSRYAAIKAVGDIGGEKAIDALIEVIGTGETGVVEARAALVNIGRPAAAKLADVLDKSHQYRIEAGEALARIGEPALDALLPVADHEDAKIRKHVAELLSRIEGDDPRPGQRLAEMLRTDENVAVQIYAATMLGKRQDATSRELLIAASKHHDPTIRRYTMRPLAANALAHPPSFERIASAIRGEQTEVSLEAKRALGDIKDERIADVLLPVLLLDLKAEENEVRAAAGDVLAKMADRRADEPSLTALKDKAPRVRLAAAKALLRIDDRKPVKAIVEALIWDVKHKESGRSFAARSLLESIDAPEAVEPLINAMQVDRNVEDHRVRGFAAMRLGYLGDAKAVQPLIETLSDNDYWVRETAARSLGRIGDKAAIDPLKKVLGDENGSVRSAAEKAIRLIEEGS